MPQDSADAPSPRTQEGPAPGAPELQRVRPHRLASMHLWVQDPGRGGPVALSAPPRDLRRPTTLGAAAPGLQGLLPPTSQGGPLASAVMGVWGLLAEVTLPLAEPLGRQEGSLAGTWALTALTSQMLREVQVLPPGHTALEQGLSSLLTSSDGYSCG